MSPKYSKYGAGDKNASKLVTPLATMHGDSHMIATHEGWVGQCSYLLRPQPYDYLYFLILLGCS